MFNKFVLTVDAVVITAAETEKRIRDTVESGEVNFSERDIKFLLLMLDDTRAKLVESTSRLEALEHG